MVKNRTAWNDPSRKVVSGIFSSDTEVERVLNELEDRSYYDTDVSMLMSDKTQKRYPKLEKSSKMPEGAATGGVTGGLLGALIGGLSMAGVVLIPGAGLLIAGPVIGALSGGAVGAAAGGLFGALIGLGIPEHEAKRYEEALKEEGNVLLIAHVDKNDVEDVRDIFRSHHARDIHIDLEEQGARRDTPMYSTRDRI